VKSENAQLKLTWFWSGSHRGISNRQVVNRCTVAFYQAAEVKAVRIAVVTTNICRLLFAGSEPCKLANLGHNLNVDFAGVLEFEFEAPAGRPILSGVEIVEPKRETIGDDPLFAHTT